MLQVQHASGANMQSYNKATKKQPQTMQLQNKRSHQHAATSWAPHLIAKVIILAAAVRRLAHAGAYARLDAHAHLHAPCGSLGSEGAQLARANTRLQASLGRVLSMLIMLQPWSARTWVPASGAVASPIPCRAPDRTSGSHTLQASSSSFAMQADEMLPASEFRCRERWSATAWLALQQLQPNWGQKGRLPMLGGA